MILATALMTMFALVMPLAGGAQADHNSYVLNLEPEPAPVSPVSDLATFTASLAAPCPEADNCQIDVEVETGPGEDNNPFSPDHGCFIATGATECSIGFTSADDGTNRVRAWVDDDNDDSTFDADTAERASVQTTPGNHLEGDDTDVLNKTWAFPGVAKTFTGGPVTSIRRISDPHEIKCSFDDGFGDPVVNANCDAIVLPGGRNVDNDVDNNPDTVPGYIGECTTTGPLGECTITYTSSEVGTDPINVFSDNDGDDRDDGGRNPEASGTVSVKWNSDIKFGPCAGLNYNDSRAKQGGGRVIAGSPLANTINGGPGPDTICALGGDDKVDGNGGNDHVLAGLGNDNVVGEGGDDNLDGNEGRDSLAGGDGIDSIVAGGQNDILVGGNGNDIMKGQDGTDALRGKGGADTMEGGTDADIMFGHGGNDTLKGGGGNDELNGGIGRDTCLPGPGRDQVRRCE